MSVLEVKYKDRAGGYIRITKAGFRYGDCAPVAFFGFVDRDINAKECMTFATVDKDTAAEEG